jgi:hypothetical protein
MAIARGGAGIGFFGGFGPTAASLVTPGAPQKVDALLYTATAGLSPVVSRKLGAGPHGA